MSIVYDYLKQIHDQKETKKVAPEVPPAKRSFGFPSWVKVTVVGILGCLLLGAGLYFFPPKAEKTTIKLYQASEKSRVGQPKTSDSGYILEGIIYNPSRPFAIINGKMLEAGGRIGEFEVVQITPDTVSLRNTNDNTSRTIRL